MKAASITLATSALLACTSAFAAAPATEKDGVLVDAKGMTLYTYTEDADGKSTCNGKCAVNWPPLKAEAGSVASGEWTLIKRDDGSLQWAYDDDPLYTYIQDSKPGDRTGDGKGGVWELAIP